MNEVNERFLFVYFTIYHVTIDIDKKQISESKNSLSKESDVDISLPLFVMYQWPNRQFVKVNHKFT